MNEIPPSRPAARREPRARDELPRQGQHLVWRALDAVFVLCSSFGHVLGADCSANRREPVVRIRQVALDDPEEPLLQCGGYGTPAAFAHKDLIDRSDWSYLDCGAAEENFIRNIQKFSW